MRGMRSHDTGTRSSLSTSKREASLQSCSVEILRQASFQIHKQQFRQHFAAGAHVDFNLKRLVFLEIKINNN